MWPFRKKPSFGEFAMQRADREIAKARQHLDEGLAALNEQIGRQRREMEAIANRPVNGVQWTPVMTPYGQILALAWKNDLETAARLLEEPAEGRA